MTVPTADPALLTAALLEDLVDCALNVGPIRAKKPGQVPSTWAGQGGASHDKLSVVLVTEEGPAGLPRAPPEGITNNEPASVGCQPSDLGHG
jgi:hypothetical protein